MVISVTLLTAEACSSCEQATDTLHRLSVDFDLHVRTVDCDEPDGQALAQTSGLAFPPGVFIDGELFCYGRLSERKLRRHLERRRASPT